MPEPFSYRNFFQFIIGIISDFSLDPGYSLHIVIVENNQLTVLCLLDVKLNIVGIDINSRLKGIYGIFRCSIGKSSMCCYLSSDKNTCFQIYRPILIGRGIFFSLGSGRETEGSWALSSKNLLVNPLTKKGTVTMESTAYTSFPA